MTTRTLTGLVAVAALAFVACAGRATIEANGSGSGGDGAGSGSGAGSSVGGGGVGGSGTGGIFSGDPECTADDQCLLANDCCTCAGYPIGAELPPCDDIQCLVPSCTSFGKTDDVVECRAGRCVAAFSCDHTYVLCDGPEPSCPPGMTASVEGGCWGTCVPVTECSSVGDCSQCNGAVHACVTEETQLGPMRHCDDLPDSCQGSASCACLGTSVCVGTFDTCTDDVSGPVCSCPDC